LIDLGFISSFCLKIVSLRTDQIAQHIDIIISIKKRTFNRFLNETITSKGSAIKRILSPRVFHMAHQRDNPEINVARSPLLSLYKEHSYSLPRTLFCASKISCIQPIFQEKPKENFPLVLTASFSKPRESSVNLLPSHQVSICLLRRKNI